MFSVVFVKGVKAGEIWSGAGVSRACLEVIFSVFGSSYLWVVCVSLRSFECGISCGISCGLIVAQ